MNAPSLDPSQITGTSIRISELREALSREILRSHAIGLQALAAFLDADDAIGLAQLRRYWLALAAGITPMACELGRLLEEETGRSARFRPSSPLPKAASQDPARRRRSGPARSPCTWPSLRCCASIACPIGNGLTELRDIRTAVKLKRMGTKPGWPDIVLVPPTGQLHCLELKRAGEGLSEEQEQFQLWCIRHNVPHSVADSFDQALKILDHWGCLRIRIGGADERAV